MKKTELKRVREEVEELRKQAAEKLVAAAKGTKKKTSRVRGAGKLVHELQVYQVELEMQNDELRRSQEILEKEREKFSTIFDFAPVGYFVLDKAAVIKNCNTMGATLVGLNRLALADKSFQSFIASNDKDKFYLFMKQLTGGGKGIKTMLQLSSSAGNLFLGQVQGSMVPDRDGVQSYFLTVLDITEKHKAEIQQQEARQRLQLALEASGSGTFKIEMEKGLLYLDAASKALLNVKKKEDVFSLVEIYKNIHPDDLARFDEALRGSVNNLKDLRIQFRIQKNTEISHIELQGRIASLDKKATHLIGVLSDITQKKKSEYEKAKAKEEEKIKLLRAVINTEEKERLRISTALHDSLGQLLYGASLKFQNTREAGDSSFASALDLLNSAILQTRNISFELAPSILIDYGLQVAIPEMARRLQSDSLKIETSFSGLSTRMGIEVETMIFRILQELLNNVIKHSGAGTCQVNLVKTNTTLRITVSDNGKGMTGKKIMSSGMGLHSIKNRIALYKGTLRIIRRNTGGTCVKISFDNIKEPGNGTV